MVVLVLAAVLAYPRVGAWYLRSKAIPRMAARYGAEVTVGSIDVAFGHATLRDVELPDGFHRAAAELYAALAGFKDRPSPPLEEEVTALVGSLEAQYDAFMAGRSRPSLLAPDASQLPSADEIGADVEEFLRSFSVDGSAETGEAGGA